MEIEIADKILKEADSNWIEYARENNLPKPLDTYFGCGLYGCAYYTDTPGKVLKLTTDRAEAEFMRYQQERNFPGFVRVDSVVKIDFSNVDFSQFNQSEAIEMLPDDDFAYIIWKDKVEQCCTDTFFDLANLYDIPQHRLENLFISSMYKYREIFESRPGPHRQEWDELISNAHPSFTRIFSSLRILFEEGLIVTDLSMNNVGRDKGSLQFVAFDGQIRSSTKNYVWLPPFDILEV